MAMSVAKAVKQPHTDGFEENASAFLSQDESIASSTDLKTAGNAVLAVTAGGKTDDGNGVAGRGANVRRMLRKRLGEEVYSSWFQSMEFDAFDGETLKGVFSDQISAQLGSVALRRHAAANAARPSSPASSRSTSPCASPARFRLAQSWSSRTVASSGG